MKTSILLTIRDRMNVNSVTRFVCLLLLMRNKSMGLRQLTELLKTSQNTTSTTLRALEKQGLIEVHRDFNSTQWSLTSTTDARLRALTNGLIK